MNRHLAWSDCTPGAAWRHTCWTHEAYKTFLAASALTIPVLLACAQGLRLECITVDVLHCVDQGVAPHIIGNIFWIFAARRKVFFSYLSNIY